MDFWLLGGASILFAALYAIAQPFRGAIPRYEGGLIGAGVSITILSMFVNGPHFIASYRLAYSRDRSFIERNRRELVVIPIGLIVVAAVGIGLALWTDGVGSADSTVVLSGLALAMFLTVGWHYVKQIYGCVRVAAVFDDYEMGPSQMTIIRYGLFPLWIRGLVIVGDASMSLDAISYSWFSSPGWLRVLVNIASAIGAAAIIGSFVEVFRRTGQRPSARMIVPLVVLYVWWVPGAEIGMPIAAIAFFHSLQYLPFVAKVERSRAEDAVAEKGSVGRQIAFVCGSLFVGNLVAFYLLPGVFDVALGSVAKSGFLATGLAAAIVINVHHYYVDHVIWRLRDDPYTRELLLR